MRAIEDQLTNLLLVDDSRNPILGLYWTDTWHYKVYFYDDSHERKEYTNGSLTSTDSFTYPYSHNGGWVSYNTVIICPVVVMAINGGIGKFRLNFPDSLPDVIRSASHEWIGR